MFKLAGVFANITQPITLIALIIAVFAIILLFLAKKLAIIFIKNKYPDKKQDDENYQEKLLNVTLVFKSIAAALAVGACILTLVF